MSKILLFLLYILVNSLTIASNYRLEIHQDEINLQQSVNFCISLDYNIILDTYIIHKTDQSDIYFSSNILEKCKPPIVNFTLKRKITNFGTQIPYNVKKFNEKIDFLKIKIT